MSNLIFFALEFATLLLPAAAVFAIDKVIYPKGKRKRDAVYIFLFALYIAAVCNVTQVSTIYQIARSGINISPYRINMIPFENAGRPIEQIMNIIMFVALGVFLPVIWPKNRKLWRCFLAGLYVSGLIEFLQLFNHRRTDINDLIMNSTGAVAGYLFYKIISWILDKSRESKQREELGASGLVVNNNYGIGFFIYVTAMFAGRFFLFNEYGLNRLFFT